MIKEIPPIHIDNQILDVFNLPETAQKELAAFHEFLVFKYHSRKPLVQSEKQRILSAIFQEADGTLPDNYTLNREELHER